MKKIFVLCISFLFLVSCINIQDGENSVKINKNGVDIKDGENSVKINKDGIDIQDGGNSVKLHSGGVDIKDSHDNNLSVSSKGKKLSSLVLNDSQISEEDKVQFGNIIEEKFETKDCKKQFNQLLKTFGNNYDSCFIHRKKISSCDSKKINSKVNIAIVFDASGSMGKKIGDERMIDIAKEELKDYVGDLESSIGGGIILYGHKGNNAKNGKEDSCKGIELVGEFKKSKGNLLSKLQSVEPKGWTPIEKSLKYADEYLTKISGKNDQKIILLVSDGKETCGGNPIAKAREIGKKKNTYIDVIGFNVYGDTQSQLINISKAGGGKYSNVRSRVDFQRVLNDMQSFTNEVKCGASQASIQLRNSVDILNKFYTCTYMLKEEEVKILTHMTKDCEYTVEDMMNQRIEKYENKFEEIKEKAQEGLSNFQESIDDVLDEF